MCGIIGIIGYEPAAPQLVDALKRLEYRGYDSAGVATLEGGALTRRRAEGKLKNLEKKLGLEPLSGTIGIGHTRWATHGRPTENNAHPHATEKLAVVHNGIIENFSRTAPRAGRQGRQILDRDRHRSDRASCHRRNETRRFAGRRGEERLCRGCAALSRSLSCSPARTILLIGARRGSPLAVGFGDGAMYVGSDAIALAPFTDMVSYLDDGDWVVVTRKGAEIHDSDGKIVQRARAEVASLGAADRQGQSSPLHGEGNLRAARSRRPYARQLYRHGDGAGRAADAAAVRFQEAHRVSIAACGTAYYAGMVARYWFENFAHLPVEVDIASEFRYRDVPLGDGNLAIFVSQSGETADTLASLRYARAHKQHVLSVVNVPTSSIARESDVVMPTLAGPEIGVASTKAFTCQLAALAALAIAAGRARGVLSEADEKELVHALIEMPRHLNDALGARAADRADRARSRQMPRRALSRPRHELSAGARRRAEAQGNFLHPCRGLCGGRAQARPDRADRRKHAGDRDRAARQGVREDRLQHAGSRRARRPAHSDDAMPRAQAPPPANRRRR